MTRTHRAIALTALPLLAIAAPPTPAAAARAPVARAPDAAAQDAADLARFEHRAALSKELGATEMTVTDELPTALWELDDGDPYPGWYINHATLFKLFPPAEVQPFMDMGYAARLQRIVGQRCAILRRYGLKGVWSANEPAVMPEAFFVAHPELRGPRIDHPSRSRKAHFAPNVDRPETLRLFRLSIQALLKTCPEVETFNWVTTDAGSGFDWVPALYPGANGNSAFRDRPIADRVAGFLINAQQAAKEIGRDIRINLNQIEPRQWMIPTFSPDVLENVVRKLPRGLAVEGLEGPDGRRFASGGRSGFSAGAFYPVVGLAAPSFGPVAPPPADHVMIAFGDAASTDFNFRLQKATRGLPMRTMAERLAALRTFATGEVGEAQADNLIELWVALGDVRRYLDVLDFGGMLRFGHVLNRWITRPMVPYPLALSDAEKKEYRRYLFQAKGEEQAADLVDIQAMREYEGWGAKLLFQRTIELAMPRAERALALAQGIAAAPGDAARRGEWALTAKRIQALIYLLRSADDMVSYQAQLDRVTALGAKPEADPVLGVQSDWARTDMLDLARREIDTMIDLKRLLESTSEPILDFAPTAADETIMRLGPDTPRAIGRKIETMNAHWRDYDRLFTLPNP